MPVASKIYGNVAEVLIHDNEMVKAGQVLVKIDARDYQAKSDLAAAALALAQAQSQAAKAGVPLTAQDDIQRNQRRAGATGGGRGGVDARHGGLCAGLGGGGFLRAVDRGIEAGHRGPGPGRSGSHEAAGGTRPRSRSCSTTPTWRPSA